MPLSAAERQRRYREKQKLTPQTLEAYKQKKHEYYMKSRKPIGLCDDREKRLRRRNWRNAQRDRRDHVKHTRSTFNVDTQSSPSSESVDSDVEPSPASSLGAIRQRYLRRIKRLNIINKYLKSKLRGVQKQCCRLKRKVTTAGMPTTPLSKSTYLMTQSPSKVKKTLVFHHALVQELNNTHRSARSYREKQILSKVLSGKVLKKYKMLSVANREFGIRRRQTLQHLRNKAKEPGLGYIPRKYCRFKIADAKHVVEQFFLEDINSRASAGKKETVTRNKEKKQKRYLNDTLKNLHKKFCAEKGMISYSAFCKFRPFWVVQSVERDTCACKKCENVKLKVRALHKLGELCTQDPSVLLSQIRCSVNSQSCMYNECKLCRNKSVTFTDNATNDAKASWFQWISKAEKRVRREADGNEKTFNVRVVVKERTVGTIESLKDGLQCDLKLLSVHTYNITHQYKQLKYLREHLSSNECVVLVDFSENYAAKYATEIQSMHFGASRNQVTLHTGVYYTADEKRSFCTISDNNRHDPAAIWAHLRPVLTTMRNCNSIDTIHFISDSPSTQYRSVKNLYLMRKLIHLEHKFSYATWNFTEASHGKGPADGVGALVKHTADRLVKNGNDIPNASALLNALSGTVAVDMFMITDDDILKVDKVTLEADELQTLKLPGLMKVHQIRSSAVEPYPFDRRVLSCFCHPSCNCLEPIAIVWKNVLPVVANRERIKATKCKKPRKKCTKRVNRGVRTTRHAPTYSKKPRSVIVKPRPIASRPPLPRQPTWLTKKKTLANADNTSSFVTPVETADPTVDVRPNASLATEEPSLELLVAIDSDTTLSLEQSHTPDLVPSAIPSLEQSVTLKANMTPSLDQSSHGDVVLSSVELNFTPLQCSHVEGCSEVKTSVFYGSHKQCLTKSLCVDAKAHRSARTIRKPAKFND